MRYKFFTVPVFNPDAGTQALNAFVASHVVVQVDRLLGRKLLGKWNEHDFSH